MKVLNSTLKKGLDGKFNVMRYYENKAKYKVPEKYES